MQKWLHKYRFVLGACAKSLWVSLPLLAFINIGIWVSYYRGTSALDLSESTALAIGTGLSLIAGGLLSYWLQIKRIMKNEALSIEQINALREPARSKMFRLVGPF